MKNIAKSVLVALVIVLALAGIAEAMIVEKIETDISGDVEKVLGKITKGDTQGQIYDDYIPGRIDWKKVPERVRLPDGMDPRKIPIGTEVVIMSKSGDLNYLLPKKIARVAVIKNAAQGEYHPPPEPKPDLSELQAKIDNLGRENNILQSRIFEIEDKYEKLAARMEELSKSVSDLQQVDRFEKEGPGQQSGVGPPQQEVMPVPEILPQKTDTQPIIPDKKNPDSGARTLGIVIIAVLVVALLLAIIFFIRKRIQRIKDEDDRNNFGPMTKRFSERTGEERIEKRE